jgi:alkylated DNA repair dioxygenase AlkB
MSQNNDEECFKTVYVRDKDGSPTVYTLTSDRLTRIAHELVEEIASCGDDEIKWRPSGTASSREIASLAWDKRNGSSYSLSKKKPCASDKFPEFMHDALRAITKSCGVPFNFVEGTKYPDRKSGVGFHSHADKKTFKYHGTVASFLVGASRVFLIERDGPRCRDKIFNVTMNNGTVLVMTGDAHDKFRSCIKPLSTKKETTRMVMTMETYTTILQNHPLRLAKNNFLVKHPVSDELSINFNFRLHLGCDANLENEIKIKVGYNDNEDDYQESFTINDVSKPVPIVVDEDISSDDDCDVTDN